MEIFMLRGESCAALAFELLCGHVCAGARVARWQRAEDLAAECGSSREVVVVAHLASLPGGVEWVERRLSEVTPRPAAVLIAPDATPARTLERWARAGRGLVLEGTDPGDVRRALQAAASGRAFIEPSVAPAVLAAAEERRAEEALGQIDPRGLLPPRLRRVARLAAKGWSYERIAGELGLSEATIKSYLHETYEVLRVAGRDELMRQRNGTAVA